MIPKEKHDSIQLLISESMEFHFDLSFVYLHGDHVMHFIGTVHYWNEKAGEIRVVNSFNDIVRMQLVNLIAVYTIK
nr:YolD-like family protein [Bacillus sp. V2I10]